MSEFGGSLKNIVMKSIEAIGNKASDLAAGAKQKVGEYNLANEQKDVFSEIGSKVFELSKQGVAFPEELQEDLKKAAEIGAELDRIRAEKEAAEKAKQEAAEQEAAEKAKQETAKQEAEAAATDKKDKEAPEYREAPVIEMPRFDGPVAAEYAARDDRDVPVIRVDDPDEKNGDGDFADCPMSAAINDLFEQMPPVDKMMDKVNSSLDELGENLKKFSDEFDKQLNDFSDQMMGTEKKDPGDKE